MGQSVILITQGSWSVSIKEAEHTIKGWHSRATLAKLRFQQLDCLKDRAPGYPPLTISLASYRSPQDISYIPNVLQGQLDTTWYSSMCSLKTIICTAMCLCWFSLPKTNSSIITLTEEEQEEIVDAFNDHRSEAYPPAANMQKLVFKLEHTMIVLSLVTV